jgi:alpha-mannosidase
MKPTYHIVSHTHWDREWYKSFSQFRAMLVNLVDDLLEILKNDPRYVCFTLDGQTAVLDDYLAVRPDREAELSRLISSGRILVGPWYVLPDEFLVSGEATVRNLLLGTRTARSFGGGMQVGYIPDSFGHIAMMPAILKGFGISAALVYRGFGGEPGETTSEYWWSAPDGTRCLLIHLYRNGYSGGYFHQDTNQQILDRFATVKAELDQRATTSHRLLMNGGDHHWPDPKLPRTLQLLREHFEGEFVHSSVPAYVDAVRKEVDGLPEVQGELRFGYRYAFVVIGGVYSSRMYLKQENWRAQSLLERYAEPLNAFALANGMRSQLPLLRSAWKSLMQNHPHDSICGCSIDPVHREMMVRFSASEQTAQSVIDDALNYLVPSDDRAGGDDRHLYFFNPSPWARTEVAQAELAFFLQDVVVGLNPDVHVDPKLPSIKGFALIDTDGREVPFQITGRKEGFDIAYSRYNYPRQTTAEKFSLLVDVKDVPPLGLKGLRVKKAPRFPRFPSSLTTGRNYIENSLLRVEVNGRGEVTLVDKTNKRKYARLNVFEDSGDVGDEYNYSNPARDRWFTSNAGKVSVALVEKGPLRARLRVRMSMKVPESAAPNRKSRARRSAVIRIESVLSLTRNGRRLDVETTVENTARDHRFRVLFPVGIDTDAVLADSQFCVVRREQKEYNLKSFTIEQPARVAPAQRFVTVTGPDGGLSILPYGLPEYELKRDGKATIALTLLRCVGLLSGDHLATRPGGRAGWYNETPDAQCLGRHVFRYAVLPHSGREPETTALLNEEADAFHRPLLSFPRKNPGSLPPDSWFFAFFSSRLVFSSLKEAEDGNGIIVRMYNTARTPVEERVRFMLAVKEAWKARLDEEPLEQLNVTGEHEVPVCLSPGEIFTMRVQLQ